MDYRRIYDELITHRKKNVITSGYSEKHHIKPRSLGGSNDKTNLVKLTLREHFIAHLLLARFDNCRETVYALWMMRSRTDNKTSRMYAWARAEYIKHKPKTHSRKRTLNIDRTPSECTTCGKICQGPRSLKSHITQMHSGPKVTTHRGKPKGTSAWNKGLTKFHKNGL